MYALLLLLLVLCTPAPDLTALASPRFAVRESASRALAARMSWPLAVRLTLAPPAELEARRRVGAVLERYWYDAIWEPGREWPYIDAINRDKLCAPPNTELVGRYLELTLGQTCYCQGSFPQYRAATELLARDLRSSFVPPCLIRALLLRMERLSLEWDQRQRRPMPQPAQ